MSGISLSEGLDIMHRLDIGMEDNVYTAGCYLDCSHFSSGYLNYRIIEFAALESEWDGGTWDIDKLISDYLWDSDDADVLESLYFAADDAVQFLNSEIVSGGCYWTIEDNSLYLMEDTDDEV
jgi:hypothetical protein